MNDYIRPEELQQLLTSPWPPIVIDVRGPDEYRAEHIPGALHIPADQVSARLAELPTDRLVVPY